MIFKALTIPNGRLLLRITKSVLRHLSKMSEDRMNNDLPRKEKKLFAVDLSSKKKSLNSFTFQYLSRLIVL